MIVIKYTYLFFIFLNGAYFLFDLSRKRSVIFKQRDETFRSRLSSLKSSRQKHLRLISEKSRENSYSIEKTITFYDMCHVVKWLFYTGIRNNTKVYNFLFIIPSILVHMIPLLVFQHEFIVCKKNGLKVAIGAYSLFEQSATCWFCTFDPKSTRENLWLATFQTMIENVFSHYENRAVQIDVGNELPNMEKSRFFLARDIGWNVGRLFQIEIMFIYMVQVLCLLISVFTLPVTLDGMWEDYSRLKLLLYI
jgi:hypothetical protein